VLEVEPRRRAVGEKLVSANEPYFVGHFPGAPVLPGVVLCEALAQLAAVVADDESVRLVGVERGALPASRAPG
jgi:3-hydroxymyristoyl/3-hydroxydecanoyl-(acyl carrier protein) dehydratase